MKQYKLLNNIVGWCCFVFAVVVYTMTMEKSGSFWDCGEFVPSAFKLEIAHPPGFPLFLMLGKIFSLLSGANPLVAGGPGSQHVAMFCNLLSAVAASGTALFTFWITTMLTGKFVFKDGQYTTARIVSVLGAGVIASTADTFLDSQWFSAVEYIVFTSSQFFLSFNIWAILKWSNDDSKFADRWLLLIAYMTGVSIGAHLLALLGLPAVAVAFYYKKFKKTTVTGWILAVAAGFFLIGFYMKYIISYTLSYFASMDLFFVNTLGMPFNSGVLFGSLLVAAVIVSVLWYTEANSRRAYLIAMTISVVYVIIGFIIDDDVPAKFVRLLYPVGLFLSDRYGYEVRRYFNIAVLSIGFSYIGYSSYMMVPIRAEANPPVNMNRPTDPFTLKSYVDRDQYGARPLLFGPAYNLDQRSDITGYSSHGERYVKDAEHHQYVDDGPKQDYTFREDVKTFFPRMGFWQEEGKIAAYRAWLNPGYNVMNRETREVQQAFPPGQERQAQDYANSLNKKGKGEFYVKDDISWGDNIKFFFKYQVGFMYFRYFMWNFAGRQDDIQGTYGNTNGRWISGIPFIDNSHRFFTPDWPQDHLPKSALNNKARNKFYMIPLLVGLLGLIFTFFKDEKTFWFLGIFFFTTGLAQIIFQNEPPIEPRERDYATACSYAVFTIWMGFGVIGLVELVKRYLKFPEMPTVGGAIALCAIAPFLMGSQGWDDHNRNARYTSRDFAIDYLQSCAPNAILFTQGDNDTYPLWYAQEVEGIRQDIRIINLSLAGVDWYIDQLRYKMNDAAPLKITFTREQLQGQKRDVVRYRQDPRVPEGTPIELSRVMKFIASDDDRDKLLYQNGEKENYLPTKTFYMNIDTARARKMNMVDPADDNLVTRMEWTIDNGTLLKNDLITLDIVANNLMDRPIYFAVSVSPEAYLGMSKYFQLEGLTYRIVPKVNPSGSPYSAPVRLDEMYDNMLHKFRFGGIKENKNVYLDENILRMTVNIRGNFGRLAETMEDKADREAALGDSAEAKQELSRAANIVDYSLDNMPPDRVPHSVFDYSYPEVYYRAGEKEKGRKLLLDMMAHAKNELDYYKTVYSYVLNEARESGDNAYVQQLEQGAFTERHEVREYLFIMQELDQTAKKYGGTELAAQIDKQFNEYRMAFVQMPPQPAGGGMGPGGGLRK